MGAAQARQNIPCRPWLTGRLILHRTLLSPTSCRKPCRRHLQDRLRGAKGNIREARGDLAAAVRGSVLDDAALGAVLGRVDASTGEARAAVLEALRNIHTVLDDKQRERIADLLDKGWWRSRGGGGPYRV